MPSGLRRYHNSGNLHFITFSCYRRLPLLSSISARHVFEQTLEQVRVWYGLHVVGYVIMPEHVHLLVSEPDDGSLARAIQMLKQITATKLKSAASDNGVQHFWNVRYYDFNVLNQNKRIEKLRYMHRNPVKRGLVEFPEEWACSSFRHYATGITGIVKIESQWVPRELRTAESPILVKCDVRFRSHPVVQNKDD